MKRIKIASVALAILFVTLSSFLSNQSTTTVDNGLYRWFEYSGYGDPFNPANYSMAIIEPECNSDLYLCAIYAEVDFWTWQPTSDNLFELAISSCYFTQPYFGGYGQVTMKDW